VALFDAKELELQWSYRLLSAAAHGSFFGMRVTETRLSMGDAVGARNGNAQRRVRHPHRRQTLWPKSKLC